jgi:nucleotide-binding universal stress UspA family protein
VYRNIVVPIDAEHPEAAAAAFDVALSVARASDAALSLVAIQPPGGAACTPAHRRKLAEFLSRHGGRGCVREIRQAGGPFLAGARSAVRELGADLIVTTSRDPHFADCMVGPDAAHLAMFTPCSVLLVR